MKNKKHTMTIAITLFLILAFTASLIALPSVDAQTVRELTTHIFVTAQPVTGTGQPMFIIFWTDDMPPDIGEQSGQISSPTGRAGWYDIKLTVTRPDGTNDTYTHGYTDPVGGGFYNYVPVEPGEYSVIAEFPGTWKNSSSYHTWYTHDISRPDNFTVRDEPVEKWPEAPLPNDYWTRPISGASHAWSVLAGNWLGGAANQYPIGASGGTVSPYAYGSAPEAPHILWTRQFYPTGSLVDPRFGAEAYTLNHYEGVDYDSIIVDGQMHLMPAYSAHGENQFGGWETWDLYTGEQIASRPDQIVPNFGSIYIYNSGNQHGGFSYLWRSRSVEVPEVVQLAQAELLKAGLIPVHRGQNYYLNRTETPIALGTVWEMLDGYTGNTLCYIANVSSSGTQVYGKDGSIDYYNARNLGTSSNPNYYLQVWNSSHGTMIAYQEGTSAWQWRPSGMNRYPASRVFFNPISNTIVHDGNLMWTLNASMPSIQGPRNTRQNQTASIRVVREGEYVIFGTTGINDPDGIAPCWLMAVSLERGNEGNKLWETTFNPPYADDVAVGFFSPGMSLTGIYPEDEVILFENRMVQTRWAYDMMTGELLWVSEPEPQLCYYGMSDIYYDGMLLSYGSWGAGKLIAYDIRTGEVQWTYIATGEGTESPYGNAMISGAMIADDKVYTGSSEHSASTPLWRTPGLRCINASTGEEIWKILFWGTDHRIADGVLTAWNYYDGQVYAFGKGPSATTVTASPKVSVHGTRVVLEGTVTDQTSTVARNVNNQVQFSLKDTPAISDEDMQEYMQYKFMEQAYPADAKGVEVVLTVVDPNDNVYEIGRTTSDAEGNYGLTFEPLVPGDYQIIACFEGSASYYPSSATTYLTVEEAPAATPMPTPTPAPMTDTYVLGLGAGAIVAIVVIGLILILMMRKR